MLHLLLLLSSFSHAEIEASKSYSKLVSANGRGVLVLNEANDGGTVLDQFSDRIYKQVNAESDEVRDLLYDTYFGIDGEWLRSATSSSYIPGTGVLQISREADGLAVTEYAWAPMGLEWPGYVQMLKVTNTGDAAREIVVNSLHNVEVGYAVDGRFVGEEAIWVTDGSIIEKGNTTGLGMRFDSRTADASFTCDQAFANVGAFDGQCGTETEPWTLDPAIHASTEQTGGFQWTVSIEPGADAWFEVVSTFFVEGDASAPTAAVAAWQAASTDSAEALSNEQAWWSDWHADATAPAGLSDAESAIYDQSLTFLKMAQVTEEGDSYGQIPASFPASAAVGDFQHQWNITWVRDQAYAIAALTAAGKLDEARAALAFTLQGKANGYIDQVGMEYGLSVCRLYGDGSEWSDDNGSGPNIEFDNFGLTLWAIGDWVDAGGDIEFVTERNVFTDVADVLVAAIDDTNLIKPDSSIWERHWNGNEKHFTYSSAWAARGLMEAHELAVALDDDRAETYLYAATRIQDGICTQLVNDEFGLLGNLEEDPEYALDMAVVDTFNNHTLNGQDALATQTLEKLGAALAVESGHGFKRNDDGDLYDNHEWVVMDLRMAEAYRRNCQPDKAQAIEDWITNQAMANHHIIPELLEPTTGAYAGPAPMMGFGAGAYVLALSNRDAANAECESQPAPSCEDVDFTEDTGSAAGDDGAGGDGGGDGAASGDDADTGDADTGLSSDKGCNCSAGAIGPNLPALLLLLPWLRRRKAIDSTPNA